MDDTSLITTIEELNALPVGAVVRDSSDDAADIWTRDEDGYWRIAAFNLIDPLLTYFVLPGEVLRLPTVEAVDQ